MIISTNEELRLHLPSNAIDEVNLLQGILDNSEKDLLKEKLGASLYDRLCDYYASITPQDFFLDVTGGTYTQHPWVELLLNAQRTIANDAMSRYAYQQAISVNSAGVNMASSSDYDTASTQMLDKGVQGYKREAMVSLNNMLVLLEDWAEHINTPVPIDEQETGDSVPKDNDSVQETDESVRKAEIEEIITLWQESKYYYAHADLLIPHCRMLQQFIDIYENRDKFIRLVPDLRFIQDEYITDVLGEETVSRLLHSADNADKRLLKKVRRLMVAYLEERTTVLSIDKTRRQQAHDESISLRASILALIKKRQEATKADTPTTDDTDKTDGNGYKNNQSGSKIFVSPMLY